MSHLASNIPTKHYDIADVYMDRDALLEPKELTFMSKKTTSNSNLPKHANKHSLEYSDMNV